MKCSIRHCKNDAEPNRKKCESHLLQAQYHAGLYYERNEDACKARMKAWREKNPNYRRTGRPVGRPKKNQDIIDGAHA